MKTKLLSNPLLKKFQSFWYSVSNKERQYLTVLAVFLAVISIYFFVVSPIQQTIANLQQALTYQQSILQTIGPKVAEIRQLQQSTTSEKSISVNDLLATVDLSLKQNNLSPYLKEISQNNDRTVQIKFDDIAFDRMTQWLLDIWQNYHIQVSELSLQKSKTLGNVNAVLTLKTN